MTRIFSIAPVCFGFATLALATAVGCGDSSGAGGSGTTSGGGGCAPDTSEPNDTISSPAFFNDASTGISLCDQTGLTVKGSLADKNDIDAFRGFTDMNKGTCTSAPTATFTSAAAADVCFYLQDDGANPTVKSCPAGTTTNKASGYTGCCTTISGGSAKPIALTDIANLFMASSNTQFAVTIANSGASGCAAYTLNVHF